MLTRERVQAAVDDAVERGRITRNDATELVTALLAIGRRQTEELLGDLERMVVDPSTDLMLREVERARRVAGLGPSFPITATTTSPPPRSWRASASSPRPTCGACASTSSATRTASRCSRRSITGSTDSSRARPRAGPVSS